MAKITVEKVLKQVGLFAFLGSLIVFVYTINLGFQTSRQSKWPTVEGVVLKADFEKIKVESRASSNNPDIVQDKYIWKPHFEYTYQVNGKQYTSSQISTFDPTCEDESQVLDLKRLISRNRTVVVYYNPDRPEISVINPFPSLVSAWILLIVSVVSGLIGFGIFWVCRNA
ncbi:MAG: hypothetical protein Kow0029_30470 [Candidatus Rifleibacteriota bacterium]